MNNPYASPWEQFKGDWNGKHILIMGLGVQGRGVGDAKVFAEAGARVTVTDLKSEGELAESLKKLVGHQIRFVLGRHDAEDFKVADVIIRNPAVPRESPYLKVAREHGVPIKMDSSLFARYCPLPIIGITGTRGKTTTTMMTYEVLKKHYGGSVYLGGNVPGRATLELLKEMAPKESSFASWSPSTHAKSDPSGFGRTSGFSDENPGPSENVPGRTTLELLQIVEKSRKRYKKVDGSDLSGRSDPANTSGIVVLELSSWELEGWEDEKISPHIAVFTNFSEDHLNRYASMEEYFRGKLPITNYQLPSDWLVVNNDNEWTRKAAALTKAQIKWFSADDLPNEFQLSIPGEHNRANAAAALAVAEILGIDHEDAFGVLRNFRGVPGRLETIAVIDGVTYVNDTTATTPTATIAALRAIEQPTILIAGGSSKRLDLGLLTHELLHNERVKRTVLLNGEGTDELLRLFKKTEKIDAVFDNLQKAVDRARQLAHPGDVVLLSPGCASFSMFVNEFDRGEQFKQIVISWQKRR